MRTAKWCVYGLVFGLIALVSLVLTEYVAPDTTKFVLAVIGIMQPAVLMYIDAVGKEDAAAKAAGNFQGRFK